MEANHLLGMRVTSLIPLCPCWLDWVLRMGAVEVFERIEAGWGGEQVVGLAMAGAVVTALEHVPILPGRQLEQVFPAFTQAQPLHWPVLLHLQHCTIVKTIRCRSLNLHSLLYLLVRLIK